MKKYSLNKKEIDCHKIRFEKNNGRFINYFLSLLLVFFSFGGFMNRKEVISLPSPNTKGNVSLEEAINKRHSVRNFLNKDIRIEKLSQILWVAYGIKKNSLDAISSASRTVPSAGACYPFEIYVVKKDGLFLYIPKGHRIEKVLNEDLRKELANACLGQYFISEAPVSVIICFNEERISYKYGRRGRRYGNFEAGHIAQNIVLKAVTLDLGSVPIGAFDEGKVKTLLQLPDVLEPVYILPIGYPK